MAARARTVQRREAQVRRQAELDRRRDAAEVAYDVHIRRAADGAETKAQSIVSLHASACPQLLEITALCRLAPALRAVSPTAADAVGTRPHASRPTWVGAVHQGASREQRAVLLAWLREGGFALEGDADGDVLRRAREVFLAAVVWEGGERTHGTPAFMVEVVRGYELYCRGLCGAQRTAARAVHLAIPYAEASIVEREAEAARVPESSEIDKLNMLVIWSVTSPAATIIVRAEGESTQSMNERAWRRACTLPGAAGRLARLARSTPRVSAYRTAIGITASSAWCQISWYIPEGCRTMTREAMDALRASRRRGNKASECGKGGGCGV